MAKSKVKRYSNEGYVYEDDTPEEVANRSETSQNIANEAKGDTMLKSMRDQASKSKMVTKEELDKSGLSLRDYMNKQQGLARRGESAAPAAPATTPKFPAYEKTAPDLSKESRSNVTKVETIKPSSGMSLKDKVTKEAIDSIKNSGRKYPDMSVLQAPAKRAGLTAMGRKSDSTFNDFNSDSGYKKGGSVNSASRRADGIAQRGKTRGKMC
jgi:hypothetical protein